MFILHKRFVIRSCPCTDVRCIIYLLCNIISFVISNKNNYILWWPLWWYKITHIPAFYWNLGRQVLLKGNVLNQDWFIHLGGALENQEAKIAGLFLDPWLNPHRYHSRDVRFTVEIWPVSQSGTADCVVEGGCGWPALLYGDFMCQLHLHHNQARRHSRDCRGCTHHTSLVLWGQEDTLLDLAFIILGKSTQDEEF